jgi:hypothetical protein
LTEGYRKSRRLYGLFSGLLIAWELIGFEVSEMQAANWKVTILSPQAIPYVLIVLILYFAYRTILEWLPISYKAISDRSPSRQNTTAKTDFMVSHIIAIISLGIYFYQLTANKQIADSINNEQPVNLFPILIVSLGTILIIFLLPLLIRCLPLKIIHRKVILWLDRISTFIVFSCIGFYVLVTIFFIIGTYQLGLIIVCLFVLPISIGLLSIAFRFYYRFSHKLNEDFQLFELDLQTWRESRDHRQDAEEEKIHSTNLNDK